MGEEPEAQTASAVLSMLADAERAERLRLADALHDGPLQALLAARQDAEEAAAGDHELLQALPGRLEQVLEALRALVSADHEDNLDGVGLGVALRRIADETGRRGRTTVTVDVAPDTEGVHDELVRNIARELLRNTAAHARARTVAVTVALDGPRALRVTVEDDGVGYDPVRAQERTSAGHVGLARLGRTAELLGGTLTVAGRSPRGTVVDVRLQLDALQAERRADEGLRQERRWATALVATIQDGLVVLRDERVVQVNDAFCALVDRPREELLGGVPPWPFWPADDDLPQHLRSGGRTPYSGTHRLLRPDTSTVPVLVAAAPIPGGVDGPGGVLVTVKDLTERVREEERERLAAELRTTIGAARRLTAILAAVSSGRERVLAELHTTFVEHLGWRDAVVNLLGEDGRWRVEWTSSPELDEALRGEVYEPTAFAAALQPRFARAGAWLILEEADISIDGAEHVPPPSPVSGPDAWRRQDMLLVPMRDAAGEMIGLVSVDRPTTGRRPSDTEIEVLGLVAGHAALALGLVGS